jgi:hypothetical protein
MVSGSKIPRAARKTCATNARIPISPVEVAQCRCGRGGGAPSVHSRRVSRFLCARIPARSREGIGCKQHHPPLRCHPLRHRLADLEPPTNSEHVRATLRGVRRAIGTAPARKAPVLAEQARAMALIAPESLKGLRDRALLLLGFAGAFRRSELVALNVADLEETEDGFKIVIRRSKTDQEGHGATIAPEATSFWPFVN